MKFLKTGIAMSLLCMGFFSYQTLLSSYSEKCVCSEKTSSPATTEDETIQGDSKVDRLIDSLKLFNESWVWES